MLFNESVRIALNALFANKLRSILDAAAFELEPARIAIDLIKKYIAQQLKQAAAMMISPSSD